MGEQQEQIKHKGKKQIEHQGHETRDCQNKTGSGTQTETQTRTRTLDKE